MRDEFTPFDPRADFNATHRNLPHWRQSGATYFVTFRLADSLPAGVRARLQEMRELSFDESLNWIERYLDAGAGSCLFGKPVNAAIVGDALRNFDPDRYSLGSFVVMPNHVHALVQPRPSRPLTEILHGWKSFSAHQLQRRAGIHGRVWQEETFDRIVRDEVELRKFHAYILDNPAHAGLRAGSYLSGCGSAQWFAP